MSNTQKTGIAIGVAAAIFLAVVVGLWLTVKWETHVEERELERVTPTPPPVEDNILMPPPAAAPGGLWGFVSIVTLPAAAALNRFGPTGRRELRAGQPGMTRDSMDFYRPEGENGEHFVQGLSV